jgi:hypothetical protein
MSTQFVVDEKGEKVAAVIPIEEYYELMEDLEDLAAIASQRNEEFVPWEDVVKRLFPNGLPASDLQEVP